MRDWKPADPGPRFQARATPESEVDTAVVMDTLVDDAVCGTYDIESAVVIADALNARAVA